MKRRDSIVILWVLLGVVLLSISGCMSSPLKRYFQLRVPGAQMESLESIDKVVMIKKIQVAKVYDQYRMVYRTSPFELNYYSYNFWIKKPGELFVDAIGEFLIRNRIFSSVILEYSQGEPDWELLVWVRRIEDEDLGRRRFAHLAMRFEIRDYKTGQLVVSHEFDRRVLLKESKIHSVPVELSRLLEEELLELVKKISKN
jgi:uncharacterized lipoprotein YmbA